MLIDIFSIGEKTSNGIPLNYDVQDLNDIAEIYNNSNQQAPLVFTHDGTEAAGWCKKLYVRGEMLQADVTNLSEDFIKNVIKERKYANISIRLSKDKKLKHIALLGADIPADSNLTTLDFSENNNDEDIIYDFATPTIIDITGIIGYHITSENIKKQIQNKNNILIRLYSPGGSVSEAKAIYNMLLPKEPKVMIYGDTASAGTIIAMAAGKGKLGIANNSNFLIHESRYGLMGYYKANELNDLESDLKIENDNILNIYKQRNESLDMDKISEQLSNEKSFSAVEAKKIGLIDFIFDPAKEDLDFSLNIANDMLYNFDFKVEKNELTINDNKEIEMENVIDNTNLINDFKLQIDAMKSEIENKNTVINEIQVKLAETKENELKALVKSELHNLKDVIHINSEIVENLNNVLLNVAKNSITDFNELMSVFVAIKPKAPTNEFKPDMQKVGEMINVVSEGDILDVKLTDYATKNNITYNKAFDLYVENKIEL